MYKIAAPLISVLLLVVLFEVYFYTNLQYKTRTTTVSCQNSITTPMPTPPDFLFCKSLQNYKINKYRTLKVQPELTGTIKNLTFNHKIKAPDDEQSRVAFFIVDDEGERIEAYSFSDTYINNTVTFFKLKKNGEKILVDKYALKEGVKIKFTWIQDIQKTTPNVINTTKIEIDILE